MEVNFLGFELIEFLLELSAQVDVFCGDVDANQVPGIGDPNARFRWLMVHIVYSLGIDAKNICGLAVVGRDLKSEIARSGLIEMEDPGLGVRLIIKVESEQE